MASSLPETKFNFLLEDDDSDSSSSSGRIKKKESFEGEEISEPKDLLVQIPAETLTELKTKIRNITAVSNLEESAEEKLESFFTNPNIECCYISVENSNIEFTCPKSNKNLIYLVKNTSYTSIDVETMFRYMSFGNITEDFEETLITVLRFVFACLFYNTSLLPYRLKVQITRSIEKFVSVLSEVYFLHRGISIISTPSVILATRDDCLHQNDLISLYGDFIIHWCVVITTAIEDVPIDCHLIKDFDPLFILQFWTLRRQNLKRILDIVEDKSTKIMLDILKDGNSVHLEHLSELTSTLKVNIEEAGSNTKLLKSLGELCIKFNKLSFDKSSEMFSDIFHEIGVTCAESVHFSQWEHAELLLQSTCSMVVNKCRKNIDLSSMLNGNTKGSKQEIRKSIELCECFQESLKNFLQSYIEKFDDKWVFDSRSVFHEIHIFIQRCGDLLDICNTINIFFHIAITEDVGDMKFESQVRVKEKIRSFTEDFLSNLSDLKTIHDRILYVHCRQWYCTCRSFNENMKKIEAKISNLLDESFNYVSTIEEGFDILRLLYPFSKLRSLHVNFQQKYDFVYDNVLVEISGVMSFVLSVDVARFNDQMSCITQLFLKKRWLQTTYKLVNDCSWSLTTGKKENITVEYERTKYCIDRFLKEKYAIWLPGYRTTWISKLKRPLISKCTQKIGLIEVNFDRKLSKIYDEAKIWKQIGFILPSDFNRDMQQISQIMVLYNNVEDLVLTYNRIIFRLTSEEHVLFSEVMKKCQEIIRPILTIHQWDSDLSKRTVLDNLKDIKKIENSINRYKLANKKIMDTCVQISNVSILNTDNLLAITELDMIVERMKIDSIFSTMKLVKCYNSIVQQIQLIFDEFGKYFRKIKYVWTCYVEKVDSYLESAIRCCVISSLRLFVSDISDFANIKNDNPFNIQVVLNIIDTKLHFEPSIVKIVSFSERITVSILSLVNLIPRLYNKFGIGKITRKPSYAVCLSVDPVVRDLQTQIKSIFLQGLDALKEYVTKQWEPYRSFWKISADSFAHEYCDSCNSVECYENEFSSYEKLIRDMEMKTENVDINMFIVHEQKLSHVVYEECKRRLECVSSYLCKKLINRLQNIASYLNQSTISMDNACSRHELMCCINTLTEEYPHKEIEIQNIQRYIQIFEKFRFDITSDVKNYETDIVEKWYVYSNTMDRMKLKLTYY